MRRRRDDAVTALAVATLLDSARKARTHKVDPVEEHVFRLVNDAPNGAHLPLWAVMQSGSLAAVFAVSGHLLWRGRSRAATTSLIAGVGVWVAVKAVKPLVGRGRPDRHLDHVHVRGTAQTGLGYPSGHAAVACVLAMIATSDLDPPIRAAALAVAGVAGGARMYVGAHLPLDVAGGVAIGILCSRAAEAIANRCSPSRPAIAGWAG